VQPGAILASNTSTLSVDEIASATSRPESVIGTHFFSPANVMRLLEIVRGKTSSKEVVATCMQLSKTPRQVGVLVGNCRGFVGNRMLVPIVAKLSSSSKKCRASKRWNRRFPISAMAMGPLATGDLAGLDVGWRIAKNIVTWKCPGFASRSPKTAFANSVAMARKLPRAGTSTTTSGAPARIRLLVKLIRKWVEEAGIVQRQISAAEITDRCLYALVNEGARILEGGYALRASDIDIIYINGYGFPAYRGGPMWYADTVGLKRVYDRICEFQRQHGETWQPAPLLKTTCGTGPRLLLSMVENKAQLPNALADRGLIRKLDLDSLEFCPLQCIMPYNV